MKFEPVNKRSTIGWRSYTAAALFACGLIGFMAGTGVSERPGLTESMWLVKAYYVLGLFVVGGLDLGTPVGGYWWSRGLLWIAYFGAPLLTASAVMEAIIQAFAPDRWQLRRIKDHIVVFGSGQLTSSYLRLLRKHSPKVRVVVVDSDFDIIHQQELQYNYHATTIVGDLTHKYLLRRLRLTRARRVLIFSNDDFQAFEAATRILDIAPRLEGKVVLHAHNLRFMRSLQDTQLAQKCEIFNTYNLAAAGLVKSQLIAHFHRTEVQDVVVMAGFGRFGQSILEELQANAANEIQQVAVIDRDADRRVLVVDEQQKTLGEYQRTVFQGDISHPDVWRQLAGYIDLARDQPTVVLGTGEEQNNLRTALWIKQKYPNALVFVRTNDLSEFAWSIGEEHNIKNISITQLLENNIPPAWLE